MDALLRYERSRYYHPRLYYPQPFAFNIRLNYIDRPVSQY